MLFFGQNEVARRDRAAANQRVPVTKTTRPSDPQRSQRRKPRVPAVQIFILAGGLSTRMGRDKAGLRLAGRSLLTWVREAARSSGWPVRVVRRDAVPRCGPLGGVWTAFLRSRAERLVFLSCDQPFVSGALIRHLAARSGPVFACTEEGAGFPFALDRVDLPAVEEAVAGKRFSLQALAKRLGGEPELVEESLRSQLLNVNTPADLAVAKAVWAAWTISGPSAPRA